MSIAAGRLRHRVRIERPVTAQNSQTGAMEVTWETFQDQVPAAIEPLSVKDFIQSAAMQSELSCRIVFRYIAGLTPDMRIIGLNEPYDGTVFNPAGFLGDKDSGLDYITAPCSQGVNQGDF